MDPDTVELDVTLPVLLDFELPLPETVDLVAVLSDELSASVSLAQSVAIEVSA